MTGAAKKPGQVPPLWAGGSRTTETKERIRGEARRRAMLERRRAKIAQLARRSP